MPQMPYIWVTKALMLFKGSSQSLVQSAFSYAGDMWLPMFYVATSCVLDYIADHSMCS